MEKKILTLSGEFSYIFSTIKEKLKENNYTTIDIMVKQSIKEITETLYGIIVFLDTEVLNDVEKLVYVKDIAETQGLSIYIIGSQNEFDLAKEYIPNKLIKEYLRPIDVIEFCNDFISFANSQTGEKRKTLLCVDDSGQYLRMLKEWFSDKYNVVLANSGSTAIKALAKNIPDLILLDYQMPICNGKQALEMIRNDSDFVNIPVIFLTGNDNRDDIINIMQLGVQGYILKSKDSEYIKKEVNNFLAKQTEN